MKKKKIILIVPILLVLFTMSSCKGSKSNLSAQSNTSSQFEANKQFLAENGKKDGVVTTSTGLQYKVLVKGSGAKPSITSTVEVHYRGTLINGTEFDSSYKRGKSISFRLTQVIKGWGQALQLMPIGSKYRLFIPSHLAYGSRSMGAIKPNSLLIFEVELLGIK